MNLFLIECISTAFFVTGTFFYTSKKAYDPKVRMIGLLLYMFGGILFIFWTAFFQAYWFMILQIIYEFLDGKGVCHCWKEIKNKKEVMKKKK